MKLTLMFLLFASSVAHAGGVETIQLLTSLFEKQNEDQSSLPTFLTPAPSLGSTLLLKHKETTISSQLISSMFENWQNAQEPQNLSAIAMEGGVETVNRRLALQAMNSPIQVASELYIEKLRYAGETDTSVVVIINDESTVVEIQDCEIRKSPEVQEAIRLSLENADWAKLQ